MLRLLTSELRANWRTWLGALVVTSIVALVLNVAVTYWWSVAFPNDPALYGSANSPQQGHLLAGAYSLILSAGLPAILVLAIVLGVISTQQKTAHALWRLAGAIPRQVWLVFVLQTVVVTLLAAVIGTLLSVPFLQPAADFMMRFARFEDTPLSVALAPATVLATVAIVIVVGVASAAIPALRASHASPIDLVRESHDERTMGVLRWILAGGSVLVLVLQLPVFAYVAFSEANETGLIAVALNIGQILTVVIALWAPVLTPLVLSVWTRIVPSKASPSWFLARHSTRARLSVSTATITPLMVGLALYGIFFGVVASWRQALIADGMDAAINVLDGFLLFTPGALVATIGSIATVFMVSRSRNREMALLRTAGASNADVIKMLTLEALIYSVTAAILATIIIVPTSLLTSVGLVAQGYPFTIGLDLRIPALLLAVGFLGTLAAILTTGVAAMRRITPREALATN